MSGFLAPPYFFCVFILLTKIYPYDNEIYCALIINILIILMF